MGRARDRASADLNGQEFILDADADTSISADTDDQIDIKIAGADDFQFTANTFTAQSGSTIAAQALTATTITASGIVKTDDTTDATSTTDGSLQTDGGLSVVKNAVVGVDLTVDTNTLKVDASEDTVCINTTDTNFDAGADDLIVGSGTGDCGITIYTGANAGDKGSIFFADSTVGSSAEKKGQISYEQNNEIMTFLTNDTLAMQIDLNGQITKPKNPAFHVTGSTQTNINHNVDFYPQKGSSGAVIYDVNSDVSLSDNVSFSPSDVHYFVAPVTGKYMFEFRARFDNMPADITYVASTLYTSNRQHGINMHSTNWMDATASYYSHQGTVIADLDATDTAYVVLYLAGGTTGTDLDSHSFKGILIG